MENLRAIAHAAQRAADLTKQMLAYSGKGGFLVKTLDLSRCVSEVVRDCPESSCRWKGGGSQALFSERIEQTFHHKGEPP
jgi:hypothetical protein